MLQRAPRAEPPAIKVAGRHANGSGERSQIAPTDLHCEGLLCATRGESKRAVAEVQVYLKIKFLRKCEK